MSIEEEIFNKLIKKTETDWRRINGKKLYKKPDNKKVLENHQYIQNVLGIALPVNESGEVVIDDTLREIILSEHLILENFISNLATSIKKSAGEVKNLLQAFYDMMTDKTGKAIDIFSKYLHREMTRLVGAMKSTLEKLVPDTPIADGLSKKIDVLVKFYNGLDMSWVKMMAGSTVLIICKYISDKIKEVVDSIKSGGALKDKLIDLVLNSDISKVVQDSLFDVKTWLGFIGPLVGSVQYAAEVLASVTRRIVGRNVATNEAKKPNPKDHTTLTPKEMEDLVRDAQAMKKASDDKKLARKIPADQYRKVPSVDWLEDKIQIVVPKTRRASCSYGAGTRWCTAATDAQGNQFNRYYHRWGVTLYYLLPKSVDASRAGNMSDKEKEDFHAQFDDLFEGKLEDLKKKYPQWVLSDYADWNTTYSGPRGIDKMSQEDPSGKNKYLAWMVKNANDIVVLDDEGKISGRREIFARNRVINLVKSYHKLLPYIGREEKPEKGKKKAPAPKRTRFDKVAIVVHSNKPMQIFDAEDKEHDIAFLEDALKVWGVEEDKVKMTVDALLDTIDDDNEENPNPSASVKRDMDDAFGKLGRELEDKYHGEIMDKFRSGYDKPVGYAYLGTPEVEVGRLYIPVKSWIFVPMPSGIGDYVEKTGDKEFHTQDKRRQQDFVTFVNREMELQQLALRAEVIGGHTYHEAKTVADNKAPDSVNITRAFSFRIPTPRVELRQFPPNEKGIMTSYLDIFMPWSMKISDQGGDFADIGLSLGKIYQGVINDIKNYANSLDSNAPNVTGPSADPFPDKTDKWAKEEIDSLAYMWLRDNPRRPPEVEKEEDEKAVADIMSMLQEEKNNMSREGRILAKLTGTEILQETNLLQEVSLDDAMNSLYGKAGKKLVKSYNFDQGNEPGDNLKKLQGSMASKIEKTLTPSDVVPGNISRTHEPEKYRSIRDSNRAQVIYWWLRYLKTATSARDRVIGSEYILSNRDLMGVRQNFETFFQHPRHMKVTDIGKITTPEMLSDIVLKGKAAIDAENDRKMGASAVKGTEFFTGDYQYETDEGGKKILDRNGDPIILRNERGIPLFVPDSEGWVLAAAHNKGAACILGKETNWCTASPGLDYFKTYYNGRDDPLFFIHTPGKTADDPEDSGDRFQFAYGCDSGCPAFMDVTDTPLRGEEFEKLHDKLKEVLSAKGLDDRFDVVFEYEHVDLEARMKEIHEGAAARLDYAQHIDLVWDVYDDYDTTTLNTQYTVSFIYERGAFRGEEDMSRDGYDLIGELFNDANGNVSVGGSDYGGDNSHENYENIDISTGQSTVKVRISGYATFYDEGGLDDVDNFWDNVIYGVDNNYDKIKGKVRTGLVEYGILPLTKYDKLLYGSGDSAVVTGLYDPDSEEDEEDKTAEEMQEEFESHFKSLHIINFDPDDAEITFSIDFPPPKDVQMGKTQLIGDRPNHSGMQQILRRSLKVLRELIARQPSLPGFEEGDPWQDKEDTAGRSADDRLERFEYIARSTDLVTYMIVFHTKGMIDIRLHLSKLAEEEVDDIMSGLRIVDKNFPLFKAALQATVERWISKNPSQIRRTMKHDPDKVSPGVQTGAPVGATLGQPVPAQEAQDYQKSPAKKEKHRTMKVRLLTKGGNKHKEDGIKKPPTKRSKSAPPGMGA